MAETYRPAGTDLRVEVESESGPLGRPGTVRVYLQDRLMATVEATTDTEQGADGNMYPVAKLTLATAHKTRILE